MTPILNTQIPCLCGRASVCISKKINSIKIDMCILCNFEKEAKKPAPILPKIPKSINGLAKIGACGWNTAKRWHDVGLTTILLNPTNWYMFYWQREFFRDDISTWLETLSPHYPWLWLTKSDLVTLGYKIKKLPQIRQDSLGWRLWTNQFFYHSYYFPKLASKEKKERVNVYLTSEEVRRLKFFGKGYISHGIRHLLVSL